MGEAVNDVVEGLNYQVCGELIDGYEVGYLRCCENCENE